ncbi:MAG: GNAT family protein [Pseudomonadota bacterium]
MTWPAPVTLTGALGGVRPLTPKDAPALAQASADGDLGALWYTTVPRPEDVPAEIERRLALQADGQMTAFAVITPQGTPVGMTTFMHPDQENRRVEIGSTWYRKSVQRTGLNTQIKLLMLTHAFEDLDCISVEFRTHVLNTQSRRAIERLGAKLDGILRAQMILSNGSIRDTASYSIIAAEWPTVKAHLQALAYH